jgi:transcriptional regulator GlxA family with amidase domain
MSEERRPISVAILAFPEVTASVVYGLYDLFRSAGRDWGMIVEGQPGPELVRPLVVSAQPGPFAAANGVRISPDCGLDERMTPDVVCIPEIFVAPEEPLAGRFTAEIAWLKRCYAAGSTLAATCSGALMLAEAGLLTATRPQRTGRFATRWRAATRGSACIPSARSWSRAAGSAW